MEMVLALGVANDERTLMRALLLLLGSELIVSIAWDRFGIVWLMVGQVGRKIWLNQMCL